MSFFWHSVYIINIMFYLYLFYIVDARFKKNLNFDVCVIWCSDESINS